MWKHGFAWSTLVAIVALLIAACAPAAAPPPSGVPAPQVAPIAPSLSRGEAAWAKVLEAARKEGRVTAYSNVWVSDVGLAVSNAFKNRYGIAVDIITSPGASATARLKTEKRMGIMVSDMVEGGQTDIAVAKLEGLLASIADNLPVLREKGVWRLDPTLVDREGKSQLIYRVNQQSPWINTRLVKPGEVPNSWKDLLDPKWKGKIIMHDPIIQAGFYQIAVPLLDKKIWDEDYIRALYPQVKMTRSAIDSLTVLSKGDGSLLLSVADAAAGTFINEGAPIQSIDMREGMVWNAATLAAISGGPHPNATLVFLNWLLEPEGQTVVGTARGNLMVRSDVPDFRPPAARVKVTNPIFVTQEYSDRGVQLFRERWFDKVVGR